MFRFRAELQDCTGASIQLKLVEKDCELHIVLKHGRETLCKTTYPVPFIAVAEERARSFQKLAQDPKVAVANSDALERSSWQPGILLFGKRRTNYRGRRGSGHRDQWGFLHVWAVLAFAVPPRERARMYTPAAEELRADYLQSFQRFHGCWSRLCLRFFFALRTAVLLADCWRVLGIEKVLALVGKVAPAKWKRWWLG